MERWRVRDRAGDEEIIFWASMGFLGCIMKMEEAIFRKGFIREHHFTVY